MKKFAFVALALSIPGVALAAPAKKPVTARKAARAPAPSPAPAPALPVFEFKGENTNSTVDVAAKGGKCNKGKRPGEFSCYDSGPMAGLRDVFIGQSYYNGKLFYVGGIMDDSGYLPVLSAFTVKYGNPTLATKKWQSKGGSTFDNNVATWHFRGGDLELESMGGKVGESRFTFVSTENSPPSEAPKVDF